MWHVSFHSDQASCITAVCIYLYLYIYLVYTIFCAIFIAHSGLGQVLKRSPTLNLTSPRIAYHFQSAKLKMHLSTEFFIKFCKLDSYVEDMIKSTFAVKLVCSLM